MSSDTDSRRRRLADARLYLCTGSRGGPGYLEEFLHAALSGGVDIVQLRDKSLETREELELQEVVARVAAQYGVLVAVNDRADIARLVGADLFHAGQTDLPVAASRELLGREVMIGRSTHSVAQAADAEADRDVDYFCVGPVWPTPTKPGRPAVGVDVLDTVARSAPTTPWFAIGGIDHESVGWVLEAGARRVVVVRAVTDADDAHAAAHRLKTRLPGSSV